VESQASQHVERPISEHVADYMDYLKTKTVRGRRISEEHRYNVEKQLHRLVGECCFKRIGDINRQLVTKWLGEQTDASDKAPRTVLKYRTSLMTFCKWAVREGRLAANPLVGLPGVEVDEDRRQRRPLTMDEVSRLLDAAARRPLNDALMIRRGKLERFKFVC
jgi:site-specific recombinase XerC